MPERDEFYVGYLPEAPDTVARRVRTAVVALLAVALAVAGVLASMQGPIDAGTFEFGVDREFDGVVVERPYPVLLVPQDDGTVVSHLLVAFGKAGAEDLVSGMEGKAVRVVGTRIENDRDRMIEVHDVVLLDGEAGSGMVDRIAPGTVERNLGTFSLRGEIVDSKCHLGVMKPGRGRGHRACAILCIRGGVPPVLRVVDRDGNVDLLLLVDADGQPVHDRVLDLVAEPVEITGEVTLHGDRLTLYADPDTYVRLGEGV